jgi:hypothetical protein
VATKPILLRPDCALADAMTTLADKDGCSRQTWMLETLRHEVMARGIDLDGPGPDDDPLPGT